MPEVAIILREKPHKDANWQTTLVISPEHNMGGLKGEHIYLPRNIAEIHWIYGYLTGLSYVPIEGEIELRVYEQLIIIKCNVEVYDPEIRADILFFIDKVAQFLHGLQSSYPDFSFHIRMTYTLEWKE